MDILDEMTTVPPETGSSGPGPVFAEESADPTGPGVSRESDPASGPRRCLNCESELRGAFCHQCGQKDQDLDIRFSQLMGDWLGGVMGFDARIWSTLKILITRPGQLTLEFLEGRRARFVSPLRLYLMMSLFMVLSLAWSGYTLIQEPGSSSGPSLISVRASDSEELDLAEMVPEASQTFLEEGASTEPLGPGEASNDVASGSPEKSASLESPGSTAPQGDGGEGRSDAEAEGEDGNGGGLGERLEKILDKLDEEGNQKALDNSFRRYLPHALFALVPIFALQLWLLFRKRFRRYLFHLIFSLHSHALVFLIIAGTRPLDALFGWKNGGLGDLLGIAFFGYLFVALRRVYGDSRWVVGLKLMALLMVHGFALGLALLAVLVVSAIQL